MRARFFKCFFGQTAAICLFIFGVSISCLNCRKQNDIRIRANDTTPRRILWAWERAEDLRFVDADKYGVAFLAQTLVLENNSVIFRPRRQPLKVAPETYLIAVTRIETGKKSTERPTLSDTQIEPIVSFIKRTLDLPNVKAVQIDFDAAVSERAFYKNLIVNLKKQLPENMPLTITALASWCIGDAWFNDFPVDEAVPMAFQMGADTAQVRDFLSKGNDWREPLCRASYGVSTNEPLNINFKRDRRVFYFNSRAWQKSDLEKLGE